MITETLIFISRLLRPAAGILLFLLWWPHRKTRLLTCVPWIILYFTFFDVARRWTVLSSGKLLQAHQDQVAGGAPPVYDFLVFVSFLSQFRFFLIGVIIIINAAYLLSQFTQLNRFQAFLARQQRFQHLLGVLLLLSLIAPMLIAQAGIYFLSAR